MQEQGPCSAFFGGRSCFTFFLRRKHVCYFVHAQITMMFIHHRNDALHCNYNVDHKLFLLLLHTPVCVSVFVFCLGNSEHIAPLEIPWSNMCVNKGTLWCQLKMVSVQSPLPHHLIGVVKLLSIRCRRLLKEKIAWNACSTYFWCDVICHWCVCYARCNTVVSVSAIGKHIKCIMATGHVCIMDTTSDLCQ